MTDTNSILRLAQQVADNPDAVMIAVGLAVSCLIVTTALKWAKSNRRLQLVLILGVLPVVLTLTSALGWHAVQNRSQVR